MTAGNRELFLVAANRSDRDGEGIRGCWNTGEQIGVADIGRVVEAGSYYGLMAAKVTPGMVHTGADRIGGSSYSANHAPAW